MKKMMIATSNNFKSHDTLDVSQKVATYLAKKRDLLDFANIEKAANLYQKALYKLTTGETKTINSVFLKNLVNVLEGLNFKIDIPKDDDEFNIPVEGFKCEIHAKLTLEKIQQIVCNYFNVPIELLPTDSRLGDVVKCRQIIWHFSKIHFRYSSTLNGIKTGNRSHGDVLHGLKIVANQIQLDKKYAAEIDELNKQITR